MFVYHLVDGITGDRLEQLFPASAPSWARRPEPVSGSVALQVRPQPRATAAGVQEANPMAGLQHRIRPLRDVVVVSWQWPNGTEDALAAGIVLSPLGLDEQTGVLSVEHKCFREILAGRFLLDKDYWPHTKSKVTVGPGSWPSLVRQVLQVATSGYAANTDPDFEAVGGFGLPVDLPPAGSGSHSFTWFGYNLKQAAEALEDIEDEGQVVVDFRPRWDADFRLRWACEVFSEDERAGQLIDLGSTGADRAQAQYSGTTEDWTEVATVTHHTGKGSEADILYDRQSDTTPTVMARETLIARPDVETLEQLIRQKWGIYQGLRRATMQDAVSIHLDPDNPDWITPADLRLGATVQLTLEDSMYYGHRTIRRTLVGWQASGHRTITLDLQDLSFDTGV